MSDSRPALSPTDVLLSRPWCCPEPRCQPLHQLRNDDLATPAPGESFVCFGRAPAEVAFVYDGVPHTNDLRSCHYTPLKGLIANQENRDDWLMLRDAYAKAASHAADVLGQVRQAHPDMVEQTVSLPEGFADAGKDQS